MVQSQKKKLNFRHKSKIFYGVLCALPLLQFVIFYVGVNLNSFLMAFQKFTMTESVDGTYSKVVTWTFDNFSMWFEKNSLYYSWTTLGNAIGVSCKVYLISVCTGVPLGLLFSYYIYKKLWGASMFRVFLFMPAIVSSIVMVLIYKFFVNEAFPQYIEKLFGVEMKGLLNGSAKQTFAVVAFYNVYVSFGTTVLMYSNKMAGISPEIIEAAHIDGVTTVKEFWYVILPLAFPTVSIFLITGVATLFTNQYNVFSFFNGYGTTPETLRPLGYVIFDRAQANASVGREELPPLAALSMMLTLVAIPLTFGLKHLLEKFGPSED